MGTRGYAPPEQYGFAQTDERADIYALGVTFQELLGETAQKHILKKCTAIEAKKRYHHAWQIQWAILFGQFRRRILYPILAFMILASMAFATWIYTTDADARTAINIVISPRRDLIFDTVNIDALKHSDITLQEFRGDQTEIYRQLQNACPDGNFISTGYCNEEGYLLFGSFSEKYDILTGERYYFSFEGLCYISVGFYYPSPIYMKIAPEYSGVIFHCADSQSNEGLLCFSQKTLKVYGFISFFWKFKNDIRFP